MPSASSSFIKIMKHPLRSRMFLFMKLPSAFFSGVRLKAINEETCTVSVPYKWFSQNPFRSTYFACLAMAAEMSTGVLCLMHIYKKTPSVSMLVIKMEADYFKKATGTTIFSCSEGNEIQQTIEKTINSGEAQAIKVKSVGTNEAGEPVAEFSITWSFKKKTGYKNQEQKQETLHVKSRNLE
ncbi:MAG: DUF4442 domain-containing protein [Bacteroidetes bacterium]|nr:DUF4442 domain-containing protein [Bacteroidota bacterium]MBS1974087.1 DUF4442 domain-containing protein [Bacteroidota bacterium]